MNDRPLVVFVTGISGAGIKTAINILEDSGVYCIDNLPLEMIEPALAVLERNGTKGQTFVFGIRIHEEQHISQFFLLKEKLAQTYRVDDLFLTADSLTIEDRYGANRRKHPLLKSGVSLREAIVAEFDLLQKVKKAASYIIDTTNLSPQQLAQMIESRYCAEVTPRRLNVSIVSFGFKHGLLRPLDTMFDVRFLKNPFFEIGLRDKTGLDQEVRDYIMRESTAQELISRLVDWHQWILPKYHDEGKHYLRLGIGCTGGQHRSVAIVEELSRRLMAKPLANIVISKGHRDLDLPLR